MNADAIINDTSIEYVKPRDIVEGDAIMHHQRSGSSDWSWEWVQYIVTKVTKKARTEFRSMHYHFSLKRADGRGFGPYDPASIDVYPHRMTMRRVVINKEQATS